jgi:protein SCO1/2
LLRALLLAFSLVAGAGCGGGRGDGNASPLLELRLAEFGGRTFDLEAERGKVVVLFFGYTHCPDVCPTTLADFVTVRRRLGERAADARFAFITVDPERDTPEVARRYAAAFDTSFFGLSGEPASLAAAQQAFGIAAWSEQDSTGQPLVAHSTSVLVVGRNGRLAARVFFNDTRGEALYQAVLAALEQ